MIEREDGRMVLDQQEFRDLMIAEGYNPNNWYDLIQFTVESGFTIEIDGEPLIPEQS